MRGFATPKRVRTAKSSATNSWRAARPSGVVTSPTKTAARVASDSSVARRLAERGGVGADQHDDVHVRTTRTADTASERDADEQGREHR